MTRNTVFQYVKRNFLLSEKDLIFFTILNLLILLIFHHPQYCVVPADMQGPLYVLMGHCLTIPFLIISKPSDKSIKDNYHQTEACILNHLVSLFVCVSLY